MKAARILVLCAIATAGGATAFVAGSGEEKKSEAPFGPSATADVLIATSDIANSGIAATDAGIDTALSHHNLQSQTRPSSAAGERGIRTAPWRFTGANP